MDKYEYNLKLEEIDKLVDQKDYEEAAKMADTIDWKRVRNVRTLCLISEIYEASGRLEDSKQMLLRAYRRSPVGRTVLYRLVEITTALHQYDEAMEYYTEYVQAAPHDNNRYILKYQIYRGRGASVEELISILEEYLGQEYTERWAYELAKLYQKAGQTQKCLAACDDLVLWFHSGKYVMKALELKKKYAPLTPKQQEIYEQQFLEPLDEEETPEEPDDVITKVKSTDGEVIAESIMAETEKEIADEVTAHKAEIETEAAEGAAGQPADQSSTQDPQAGAAYDDKTLQMELARSMREIIAGVVKRTEEEDESEPEAPKKLQPIPPVEMTEKAQPAGRLTIDDVLLSMGERGNKSVTEAAASSAEISEASAQESTQKAVETAADLEQTADETADHSKQNETESLEHDLAAVEAEIGKAVAEELDKAADTSADKDAESEDQEQHRIRRTVTQEAAEELTEEQKEALKYTNNPEKFLSNKSALPVYREDHMPQEEVSVPQEELQQPRRLDYTREELHQEMMAGKTIRVPVEKIASLHEKYGLKELWQEQGMLRDAQTEDVEGADAVSEMADVKESADVPEMEDVRETADVSEVKEGKVPEDITSENSMDSVVDEASFEKHEDEITLEDSQNTAEDLQDSQSMEETQMETSDTEAEGNAVELTEEAAAGQQEYVPDRNETEMPEQDWNERAELQLPAHLRGLFGGFTEVEGLESQIADAVFQAVSNQGDRTSRAGNILIFGPHGSGKTTMALNIAKAVAQEKGTGTLKMARIYAADLNRKDIAATIAKIAGGTLIIEEAGDLEPGVIEQLTTAMEFRTDGLLIILEDEEQYLHDLLMSHPRFTMKFTAQIYIPVYTADELLNFAQHTANSQGYVIGQDALEELYQRISAAAEQGNSVSVTDVTELVNRAVHKSNKLLRKMSMGKKRYDENDYIILFAKDFR